MNTERHSRLTVAWVWLISAWFLAGAIFKLFWGTPALLPSIVRDLPLDLGLTYNLTIGTEIAISFVAIVKPRWGWILQIALLLIFDIVLITQIIADKTNCGCFGTMISFNPRAMLLIDSALILALVMSRPWSRLGRGLPPHLPVALAALGFAVPWIPRREVEIGGVLPTGQTVEDGWMRLPVVEWIGKEIWDTPLSQPPLNKYIDVEQLPLDGLWIFWRASCDHCARHLERLTETERGQRMIALIQLEEPGDCPTNCVVQFKPDGNFVQHAHLPPSIAYLLQTPAELVLKGGMIVEAREAVETGD